MAFKLPTSLIRPPRFSPSEIRVLNGVLLDDGAKAKVVTYKCLGCNYPVPYPDTYCGECLCEEDGI